MSYAPEDLDLICRKSGISREEAEALLDYHDGNVVRALIDLERNGKLGATPLQNDPDIRAGSEKTGTAERAGSSLRSLLGRLFRWRFKIRKDQTPVLNISVLGLALMAVFSPHTTVVAAVAALILGYKFSFDKNDPDFASESLEDRMRHAADSVRGAFGDIRRGMDGASGTKNGSQDSVQSYYDQQNQKTAGR